MNVEKSGKKGHSLLRNVDLHFVFETFQVKIRNVSQGICQRFFDLFDRPFESSAGIMEIKTTISKFLKMILPNGGAQDLLRTHFSGKAMEIHLSGCQEILKIGNKSAAQIRKILEKLHEQEKQLAGKVMGVGSETFTHSGGNGKIAINPQKCHCQQPSQPGAQSWHCPHRSPRDALAGQ